MPQLLSSSIRVARRSTGAQVSGADDEREQTLSQLLVEMDGLKRTEKGSCHCGINRLDVTRPASLRQVVLTVKFLVGNPDIGVGNRFFKSMPVTRIGNRS